MVKGLRNMVVINKKRFISTRNYKYALIATVYNGAYLGTGGVKNICLPSYCSEITEAMYIVSKFKTKMSGDTLKDINKLNIYSKRKINSIDRVYLENHEESWFVAIKYCQAINPILIKMAGFSIDVRALVEYLTILIRCGSTSDFSELDIEIIKQTSNNILLHI